MVSDLLYEVSMCREGSSRVDNLVNSERYQVVVLDYGPLVDRLLEKQVLIMVSTPSHYWRKGVWLA